MSKITFSKNQIEVLQCNPYVRRVTKNSITYSDEFKRHFIEDYLREKFIIRVYSVYILGVNQDIWHI